MAQTKTSRKVKTASSVGATVVTTSSESRFSPLRSLTPEKLVWYMEEFEAGNFADLDRTMRAMESRDDIWKVSAAKARKDIARRKWQCVPLEGYEDDPDAAKQADALKAFYASLKSVRFNCKNVSSGVRGLVAAMMRAYNDQYNVHEMVFAPQPDGSLRATLISCPLEWFTLKAGQMCYSAEGMEPEPLEPGGWLVCQSDGVGVACAVAKMFKTISLGDWLVYCGRCGHPGIHGKTNAQKGTPQWNDFVAALKAFGKEWAAATGLDDVIEKIDLSVAGTLPYPALVDRMDRAIASLQRGADLSTMSAGQGAGQGASIQGDESEIIAADNCETVTEALRAQLDPVVIAWHFGDAAEIKAGFRLVPPQRDTIDRDLKIDKQLTDQGVKLSKRDALSRYERREADPSDPDDAPLAAAPVSPSSDLRSPTSALPNEAPDAPADKTLAKLAAGLTGDMAALGAEVARVAKASDEEMPRLAQDLLTRLPDLLPKGDSQLAAAVAAQIADAFAAALKGTAQ